MVRSAFARVSWAAYLEEVPRRCYTGAGAGGYAKKHNPFAYYPDVVRAPSRCAKLVGFTQLAADLRAGTLPTYVWITPNLCDDGHDATCAGTNVEGGKQGGLVGADLWLKHRQLPRDDQIPRQTLKSDVLIIATAVVAGATVYYSHDEKARALADLAGMRGEDLPTHHPNLFRDAEIKGTASP